MERIHDLLAELCEDIKQQIKAGLRRPMECVIERYLPQVWVFETEVDICSVFIYAEGNARVFPGRGGDWNRDVTILWRRDILPKVLQSRTRESVEPGNYQMS